ncbi:hypothetical protein [Pararhizobium sp. IMCC21322]|uniref:hypothetical protein n=1 Tax=Pararhizobium sp. IMCC21322 TaxID=3067903 RepID=UPI0027426FC2|nr:hypothetical protein [Pararhizobium sp. IMCC21322]
MIGGSDAGYARQLQIAHKQRLLRMGGMPYARKVRKTEFEANAQSPSNCKPREKPKAKQIRAKRVYHREPGPKMKAILFPVSISSHPKVAPKQFAGDPATAQSLSEIMTEICVRYGLEEDEICQVKGSRYVKLAKHEFCWRAWHQTPSVVTRISRFLRTENHALVSRGICTHQARLDKGLF